MFSTHLFLFLAINALLVGADALSNGALTEKDVATISRGGVAVIPEFIPPSLVKALQNDARHLFQSGEFQPDGLTNTALSKSKQGFTSRADRQTFRGGADWTSNVGDLSARLDFLDRMTTLRNQLALGLGRPTLSKEGERRHEMTFNWYESGAKLGRHLDEHHEETKGVKGWLVGTRRSVTWLVYLNENWTEEEGGALRCYPRSSESTCAIGSHQGNLQIGWLGGNQPVFLDCFRSSGMSALYMVKKDSEIDEREVLSTRDFDVPRQPIEFVKFLPERLRDDFEQISTARLDPRFATPANGDETCNTPSQASLLADGKEGHFIDVVPRGGTLVLFDSVSLPHLVQEVTGDRQRIAATGWFHEDSQFQIEI